jgi:hypothetical protein
MKALLSALLCLLGVAGLIGCQGGGGEEDSAVRLAGTAATGSPIAGGTVNLVCASGGALAATTGAQGQWEVTLTDQTLPCAIQVSGGDLPVGVAYHSIALQPGRVNVTPLTEMIVAKMAGRLPVSWFASLDGAELASMDAGSVALARDAVQTVLNIQGALAGSNPLTAEFSPIPGDRMDDLLEALKSALVMAKLDWNSVLTNMSQGTLPSRNLLIALAAAHEEMTDAEPAITICFEGRSDRIVTVGEISAQETSTQVCIEAQAFYIDLPVAGILYRIYETPTGSMFLDVFGMIIIDPVDHVIFDTD